MKKILLFLLVAGASSLASAEPRPDLVAKVRSGEIKEARASWWGFDEQDSGTILQAAINSRVPHLIVDRMEKPWITSRRLWAVSDQRVTFEKGAVLEAKRGAFRGQYDTLIRLRCVTNAVYSGYGAELRMWKCDYTNAALYAWSEWRHAVDLNSAVNVTVEGFKVTGSGGDGVYLGEHVYGEPNRNIVLRDLDLVDHNRQAVSVITVDGLLMERVKMRGTCGTAPASGIDLEPNHTRQYLRNVLIRNCLAENNAGGGFEFATPYIDDTSEPLSVTLENCQSRGNKRGLVITQRPLAQRDIRGEIRIVNCSFDDPHDARREFVSKNEEFVPFSARYENCTFVDPKTHEKTTGSGGWKAHRSLVGWDGRELPLIRPTDGALRDGRVTLYDSKPGESVKLSRLHIRFQGHYRVYAQAGTKVVVTGHLVELSGKKATGKEDLVVRDPQGVKINSFLIKPKAAGGSVFAFTAPRTGFYTLSATTRNHAIALDASNVPIAAFRSKDTHSPSFSAISEGEWWFRTRRAGEAFAVLGSGEVANERIRMRIVEPNGTCVADLDKILYQRAWKSNKDSPAGIWRVEIRRPSEGNFDDFTCDLAGITAEFFLSPEKMWTVDRAFDARGTSQQKIEGRDYRTFLMSSPYADPGWELSAADKATGLLELPLFRDAGIFYNFQNKAPPVGKGSFRKMVDNVPGGASNIMWRAFVANAKPEVPKLVLYHSKRNIHSDVGEIDLDMEEYKAWSAARPDVYAYMTVDEWGSDVHYRWNRPGLAPAKLRTPQETEEFRKTCRSFPHTRAGRMAALKAYINRRKHLYWDDAARFGEMSSQGFINSIAAGMGAKLIMYETTNSNTWDGDDECRWELCAMNVRGAARQFARPWIWYIANCYSGWRKNGGCFYTECSYVKESIHWRGSDMEFSPEAGVSKSLETRCFYYAYLNGANGILPEHWQERMLKTDEKGAHVLTDRGEAFARYHDFTRANPDRGVTFAPVAILTPVDQLYSPWGGRSAYGDMQTYRPGDYQVDGIFYTIVPGRARHALIRKGVECCLHNNEMPMMFDMLVPDAEQSREDFLACLKNYPAALLAGEYANPAAVAKRLGDYVTGGGTLVVPRVYQKYFAPLIDKLSAGCRPLTNEKGSGVGMAYSIGLGRLVVSASDWMTPQLGESEKTIADLRAGRLTFPEISYYLGTFSKKYFPFAVKGSCQYGANRRKKGWWFWAFNNEGVTKFVDAFEEIDPSKASAISVRLPVGFENAKVRELTTGTDVAVSAGRFRWMIPSGSVAVFNVE